MERAVITGPTGVVGSALVKELHRQGVEQLGCRNRKAEEVWKELS